MPDLIKKREKSNPLRPGLDDENSALIGSGDGLRGVRLARLPLARMPNFESYTDWNAEVITFPSDQREESGSLWISAYSYVVAASKKVDTTERS